MVPSEAPRKKSQVTPLGFDPKETSSISKLTIIISEIMHLALAWNKHGLILSMYLAHWHTNKTCHTSGCSLGRLRFGNTELSIGFVTGKVAMKII
jgi:hypothetical protein